MNILLTGATGYIGTVIAQQLQEAGHHVIGVTRNQQSAARLKSRNIEPIVGDVREPAFLVQPAKEADAVIHTAIFLEEGILRGFELDYGAVNVLASALAGSNKPFIVSSSSASLGETGEQPADENRVIDWTTGRAVIDRLALDAAKDNVKSVVLRVPLFPYGRAGSIFVPLLIQKALANGFSAYIGEGTNKMSAAHVDDVARLYLLALEKAPAGSLYHVSTQNGLTMKSIAQAIGRLTNTEARGLSPEQATPLFGEFVGPLSINSQMDATKAQRELGWEVQGTPSLLDDLEHGSYRQLLTHQSSL